MWTRIYPGRDDGCASRDCGRAPTYRLDSGGVASDYCAECAHKIAASHPGQLKTCPFCGGEAWFDHVRDGWRDRREFWSVRCKECDVRTPAIANPLSPVMVWNKRSS